MHLELHCFRQLQVEFYRRIWGRRILMRRLWPGCELLRGVMRPECQSQIKQMRIRFQEVLSPHDGQ